MTYARFYLKNLVSRSPPQAKLTKNFKGGTRHVIYPWNQSQIENLYAREVEVSKILKKEHLSVGSPLKSKI